MEFSMFLQFLVFFVFLFILPNAEAETIKQTMEGSMDVEITHPEASVVGRIFSISILVENNGWEEKQHITFSIASPDGSINPISDSKVVIDKLSEGGSYGTTIDFEVSSEASVGTHFLNVLYSQVLVRNNEEPQKPTQRNVAIPILIKDEPEISIHTTHPESIFANAEFPFNVEIISEDTDLSEVSIQIVPPQDIKVRGDTMHTFSSIQQDIPISITSQIMTQEIEVATEHKIPFQIIVNYVDDIGKEKTESKTIPLLLRPRTFMEITTEGGIWIGGFFVAPYVSIGTLIGIPAAAIIHLFIRRSQKKKKPQK